MAGPVRSFTGRIPRDATAFLEREVGTIAGRVGEADAGNRLAEIKAALAELSAIESATGGT